MPPPPSPATLVVVGALLTDCPTTNIEPGAWLDVCFSPLWPKAVWG